MREYPLDRRTLLKATGVGLLAVGASQHSLASESGQGGVTEISDWHDLDAVRENLDGNYVLQADLDSQAEGYDDHVSNPSGGWNPIGDFDSPFTGTFDGGGHEIAGLSIDRPHEDGTGLFGASEGGIQNLSLTSATVTGGRSVGVLVGRNDGDVTEITVSGEVTGDSSVGGLLGRNHGAVAESAVSGDVTGEEGVGGLAGFSAGTVSGSAASGAVTTDRNAGGLVGRNVGEVVESSATGDVTGEISRVGGLVGLNTGSEATVRASWAAGAVTGEKEAGGLVGSNWERVVESSASGDVTGADEVGGLAGRNVGEILSAEASGTVTGGDEVGGFVGQNAGVVTASSASGDVTGETAVGGLVGRDGSVFSGGEIRETSATGDVTGESRAGGLVGWNDAGEVEQSIATGAVDADSSVGGVVGENDSAVADTYWDVETTGQEDGIGSGDEGGVTGLDTDQMQGEAATEHMTALDFVETWQVQADPPWYPVLFTVPVTGSVTGDGDPLADATVEFRHRVVVGRATTESDGTFEGAIPPGNYEMVVEADGFESSTETVTIQRGRHPAFDIELEALPDDDPDDGTDDGEADDADDDGPGLGVGGAIAGLGGASYLLKRRLDDIQSE